ncbi:MAG: DNA mismatch repair protein [Vezdaea aestivalis]|nr:MAG: DNA mismatch repair protein [Vezdaea aestivalis]
MAGPILPLPLDVVAQIKSSIAVTSLNGVVEGLLYNSLDAQATKIEIEVDYRLGACVVRDNGNGICRSDLGHDGKFGNLHCSSKIRGPNRLLHGRSGSFVASLASLSVVKVTSKHKEYRSQNTVILHQGKVAARLLPSPPEHAFHFAEHGTVVVVRDLFGNMPVRVKQRSLLFDAADYFEKDWMTLEETVLAVLVAWPLPFRVLIRSIQSGKSRTFLSKSDVMDINDFSMLRTARMARFSSLLSQASVEVDSRSNMWQHISASTTRLKVYAVISSVPYPTKKSQFISLGIRPIFPTRGANLLFDDINRAFSESNFGIVDEETDEGDTNNERKEAKGGRYDLRSRQAKKGGKEVDRWPAFYVNIDLHPTQDWPILEVDDLIQAPRIDEITRSIQVMFQAFLEQNHFRPRQQHSPQLSSVRGRDNLSLRGVFNKVESSEASVVQVRRGRREGQNRLGTASTSLNRSIVSSQCPKSATLIDFNNWSRVKSGSQNLFKEHHDSLRSPGTLLKRLDAVTAEPVHETQLAIRDTGNAPNVPNEVDLDPPTGERLEAKEDDVIEWSDVFSNRTFRLNSRTGQAYGIDWTPSPARLLRPLRDQGLPDRQIHKEPNDSSEEELRDRKWLKDILVKWTNPVLAPAEPSISKIGVGCDLAIHDRKKDRSSCDNAFERIRDLIPQKLTRQALQNADVIAQVDKKFILLKVHLAADEGLDPKMLLVLVDQHAADERCIVENLMTDFSRETEAIINQVCPFIQVICKIQTLPFEKPVVFEISMKETTFLATHAQHFATWGILYSLPALAKAVSNTIESSTCSVNSVPPSIAERCRTQPKLLIDLIRSELWRVHEGDQLNAGSVTSKINDSHTWIKGMAFCPPVLVNLLNSRACRSAIMFNDDLSVQDCRNLVFRLSTTSLPFVCAHGRPSMVIVGDLGDELQKHRSLTEWLRPSMTNAKESLWLKYGEKKRNS